jgi:hypothetical protein
MKLLLISLLLICNIGNGQEPKQLQVTITKVTVESNRKYFLECVDREGNKVCLRYGFSGGWIGGKFTRFAPGLKLTVHELKGKKRQGYSRSRITVNH